MIVLTASFNYFTYVLNATLSTLTKSKINFEINKCSYNVEVDDRKAQRVML